MSAPSADSESAVDQRDYRRVLGNFPTGVVAITALQADRTPAGMTVGSFTSVSLQPPLVAFLPDKGSTSFPKIRETGSFCVNVLSAHQEHVCRAFAARGIDKFAGIQWHSASSGAPIIDGAVAWIDCDIESITDAGDHYIVLGRVRGLAASEDTPLPLLFLQGGYGEFFSPWKTAAATPEMLPLLRHADLARPDMTALASKLAVECLLTADVEGELTILASAGRPSRRLVNTIGQRIPLLPPIGSSLVAWSGDDGVDAWLARLDGSTTDADAATLRAMVERVRARGWSVALSGPEQLALEAAVAHLAVPKPTQEQRQQLRVLIEQLLVTGSYEPETIEPDRGYRIRHLSVPVTPGPDTGPLALWIYGLPPVVPGAHIEDYVGPLQATADRIGDRIGTEHARTV